MSTFSLNCAANSAAEAMISRYWNNFQQFFNLFDFDMKNSLLCLQFFIFQTKQATEKLQTDKGTDRQTLSSRQYHYNQNFQILSKHYDSFSSNTSTNLIEIPKWKLYPDDNFY